MHNFPIQTLCITKLCVAASYGLWCRKSNREHSVREIQQTRESQDHSVSNKSETPKKRTNEKERDCESISKKKTELIKICDLSKVQYTFSYTYLLRPMSSWHSHSPPQEANDRDGDDILCTAHNKKGARATTNTKKMRNEHAGIYRKTHTQKINSINRFFRLSFHSLSSFCDFFF